MNFDGKVALVAGSARRVGLGWATVERLVTGGAAVVCIDRVDDSGGDGGTDHAASDRIAALQERVAELGGRSIAIDADVTVPGALEDALDTAQNAFGPLDICCCMSGTSGPTGGSGDFLDLTTVSWQRCIDVNLNGPFFVAQSVAKRMISGGRGGAITILSSYAGVHPSPTAGAIGVARAGVNFLVKALAVELGPHGIRVNAVCPLGVDPGASDAANSGLDELVQRVYGSADRAAWARDQIPLGRLQQADETAAVVAFLSSDAASFVSGQSVSVAGGSTT